MTTKKEKLTIIPDRVRDLEGYVVLEIGEPIRLDSLKRFETLREAREYAEIMFLNYGKRSHILKIDRAYLIDQYCKRK
jgi:hypothetical protein